MTPTTIINGSWFGSAIVATDDKLFSCAFRDGLHDKQFKRLSKNSGTCFEMLSTDKMFRILFEMYDPYYKSGMTFVNTDEIADNCWGPRCNRNTWMVGYGFSVIDDDEGRLVVGGPVASWDKKGFVPEAYLSTGNIGLVEQKNVLKLPTR